MSLITGMLLIVKDLVKHFIKGGYFQSKIVVKAVDGVSFSVRKGSTLGLVGESGSGKTTVGKTILRLVEPTSGSAIFDGVDIFKLSKRELRRFRKRMQIVYQDPFSSMNPRMRIVDIVGRPLMIHGIVENKEDKESEVARLLESVGIDPENMYRYPHEFSGGQRQRIAIARAISVKPEFIVLDEPTSALDVSVQAQILKLLKDLQKELDLSYLFISHDLSVVNYMSEEVAVMYAGEIVELGRSEDVFQDPLHPYTEALLFSVPIPDPGKREIRTIEGEPPSPVSPPKGCRFHPRCPYAEEICKVKEPPLIRVKNRQVMCWRY